MPLIEYFAESCSTSRQRVLPNIYIHYLISTLVIYIHIRTYPYSYLLYRIYYMMQSNFTLNFSFTRLDGQVF